ncbi:MAG: hypothetical protein JWQ20_4545 [Conexibacter sp.]|nr:hypothetical protein [Conexibacter sp.]
MHDDQLAIDADLARQIIYDREPQWRSEPVIRST